MISKLSDLASFSNGEKVTFSEHGLYKVFGSNGPIGYSNQFNRTGPSIVIGRVGANAGSVRFTQHNIWATDNTITLTNIKDSILPYFLFLVVENLDFNRMTGGSAQPLINKKILDSQRFTIPSLAIQRKVLDIIQTLDIMITLKNQINDNLVA